MEKLYFVTILTPRSRNTKLITHLQVFVFFNYPRGDFWERFVIAEKKETRFLLNTLLNNLLTFVKSAEILLVKFFCSVENI